MKLHHSSAHCQLLILATLLPTVAPAATILFDQQPDGANGYNISSFRAADDMSLIGPITVEALRFWADSPTPNPLDPGQPQWSGTISWAIYQNSGGSLGSVVDSGNTSSVTVTDTGVLEFGFFERFQLDFTIDPLALATGQYWIEFHDGSTIMGLPGNHFYWDTAGADNLDAKWNLGPTLPTDPIVPSTGLAFELFDSNPVQTAVPEPSTMGLMALGLLGVLAFAGSRPMRNARMHPLHETWRFR